MLGAHFLQSSQPSFLECVPVRVGVWGSLRACTCSCSDFVKGVPTECCLQREMDRIKEENRLLRREMARQAASNTGTVQVRDDVVVREESS